MKYMTKKFSDKYNETDYINYDETDDTNYDDDIDDLEGYQKIIVVTRHKERE